MSTLMRDPSSRLAEARSLGVTYMRRNNLMYGAVALTGSTFLSRFLAGRLGRPAAVIVPTGVSILVAYLADMSDEDAVYTALGSLFGSVLGVAL